MAGIYIHIPFCKQACYYCDFHFTTSTQNREAVISAISKEITLKAKRMQGQKIESIYFGGGTPSILSSDSLFQLIDQITTNYDVLATAEITLEANPDDLTAQKIKELRQLPINRFSIGVQSFFEEDLQWMNRVHHAEEALGCVKRSQDAGFENLTIDLIYGFPLLNDEKWRNNIQTAIDLRVPHISAYSMTVESKTALAHQIKTGKTTAMDDKQSAHQFLTLVDTLQANGFEHYEISNYCLPGHYAIHNTNYWRGKPYLGIGPSAHGYDGENRYMNVPNNMKYLKEIETGRLSETVEKLSLADKFNEYVMTALRTMWGIDLNLIETNFGIGAKKYLLQSTVKPIEKLQVEQIDNKLILTKQGKLFADGIAASFFVDEEDMDF